MISVTFLAAVVYLWNLSVSGYANTYYAMAAQAASQDWGAFFYLVASQGDATWIVAAQGAATAADIQLEAGKPVLTMGGFSGGDAAPTTDEFRSLVKTGQVRFVLAGGREGRGGPSGNSQVTTWVIASCSPVSLGGTSATTLYDCAGRRLTAVATGRSPAARHRAGPT